MSSFSQEIRKRALKRAKEYPCIPNDVDVEMFKMNDDETRDVKRGKPKHTDHCKSRLALLASEINQWEDDTVSTKVKQADVDQYGKIDLNIVDNNAHCCENKENKCKFSYNNDDDDSSINNTSKQKQSGQSVVNSDNNSKEKRKVELRSSFVNRLQAQGFYKTENTHLICDLNTIKSPAADKMQNNTLKPDTQMPDKLINIKSSKRNDTGTSALSTVSIDQDVKNRLSNSAKSCVVSAQNKNPTCFTKASDNKRSRHDSRRATRFSLSKLKGKDPSQLTVKERMKLFESGKTVNNIASNAIKKDVKPSLSDKHELSSKNMSKDMEISEEVKRDQDKFVVSSEPKIVNFVEKLPHTPKQNLKASGTDYRTARTPKTINTVVFSTPLTDHNPPIEETDSDESPLVESSHGDSSEEMNPPSSESCIDSEAPKSPDSETSFGQEILIATKDILSSYSTTTKDFDVSENTRLNDINSLVQLNELYSGQESLSPSPPKRSRENSNILISGEDISEESTSFTYAKRRSSESSLNELAKSLGQTNGTDEEGIITGVYCPTETMQYKVKRKIAALNEMLIRERTVTVQALRALNLCISNSAHLNSDAHTEACKVWLLSHQRSIAIQQELDRLTVENLLHASNVNAGNVSKGNVVISDIKVPIKIEMLHEDSRNGVNNYLVCLAKYEENVYASNVIALNKNTITRDTTTNKFCVQFSNKFVLTNVYSDFKIIIEIYNMTVEANIAKTDKKGRKFKNPVKKHHKDQCNSNNNTPQKSHELNGVNPFVNVGHIVFSINEVRRTQFMLTQKQISHDLLVGNIQMKIACSPVINCEHRGFLTMYEVITGFGAWRRYWFYQRGTTLLYWKYPDQEQTQAPINTLDLKECITKVVDTVGIEICARFHTFMLEFEQCKGHVKRYLLSADNAEERIEWCNNLNVILRTFQTWQHNSK